MTRPASWTLYAVLLLPTLVLSLLSVWSWSSTSLSRNAFVAGLAWFALLLFIRSLSPQPLRHGVLLWLLAVAALISAGLWQWHLAGPPADWNLRFTIWDLGFGNRQLSIVGRWLRSPLLWSLGFALLLLVAHLFRRRWAADADPLLFVSATLLTGIGLVMLLRLAPAEAILRRKPSLRLLPLKQGVWTALGLGVYLLSLRLLPGRRLLYASRWQYLYIWLAIGLILFTTVFGREINGRHLWIGVGPLTLQSVEIVKLLVLFFIASYFSAKPYIHLRHIGRFHVPSWRSMGPYLLVWGVALAPVFLQGDLGPTFLLFAVFLAMFYVGSTARAPLLFGLLLAVLLGVSCYVWGKPAIVRIRTDMWLHPFSYSESVAQALWGLSAGGWMGTGIGRGMPEQIPVVHSDFSIAPIAEELGFVGVLAILTVYLAFFTRSYWVAVRASHRFHSMLATGILVLLGMQTIIILAGAAQLLPLTGITLPFVSYGGSSMLVNFIMLALLMRLSETSPAHV